VEADSELENSGKGNLPACLKRSLDRPDLTRGTGAVIMIANWPYPQVKFYRKLQVLLFFALWSVVERLDGK
jgi:hypothetical protein